jgi:hypothetical protein
MFTQIARAFAAAALILGLTTATTLADSPTPAIHYDTSMTALYGSTAPYAGTLDLRIGSDGIVSGYYHPESVMSFVVVTGGRDGNSIWFDIGQTDPIYVSATIKDGIITGQAIGKDTPGAPFTFKATPSAAPGT